MRNYIILFSISILFSQTDKMYVGDLDEEEVSLFSFKKKTIEKVPFSNSYIIYGKYNGVNWETGEIDFVGNDGRLYSEPTFVKSIKNSNNELSNTACYSFYPIILNVIPYHYFTLVHPCSELICLL